MSQIGKTIKTVEVEPVQLPAPLVMPKAPREEPGKTPSPSPTLPDPSPVGAPGA